MTPRAIYISYYTMVRKELVRMLRIWSQTFLPSVITSTLYFVVFGALIGSQIAPIDGFSYMQFIVPGLVMMAVITNSYTNTVSTFYFAKFTRSIDEVLVSPTPNWVVMMGFISGGVARGVMVGFLVFLISLFFADLTIVNGWVIFAALILTSTLFSLGGLINGIFAKGFDGISIVPTFVLTPLTYLGGIFYSISFLPEFWQGVSLFNPILYMVNAFRYGFLGITDVPLLYCFAILIVFNVVFFGIVAWLFKKGTGVKT